MSAASGRWDDLSLRLVSAIGLGALGLVAVLVGGAFFAVLVAAIVALMVWELARMVAPEDQARTMAMGALAGIGLLVSHVVPAPAALLLVLLPSLAGLFTIRGAPGVYAVMALLVMAAGYGLVGFRAEHGSLWLVWLVLVVTVTDIFGYFAGRLIGGPKFFPSVSPKKTWSGAVAGWIAAAVVGAGFLVFTTAGRDLVWLSAVLSLASQIGDIAESWVKRYLGAKDTSSILPGHGGMCDRFDGMLGAALLMLLAAQVTAVPDVQI